MMAGMDDKEDPEDYITIEAMSGLSRIMSEIDESHIRAILINVALKIRPCFEKVEYCTSPMVENSLCRSGFTPQGLFLLVIFSSTNKSVGHCVEFVVVFSLVGLSLIHI